MPLYADESYLKDAARCLIPGAEVPLLRGGCSFSRVYPLSQYPVFLRAGALIPLVRKYAEPLLGGPAVTGCPRSAAPGMVAECPEPAPACPMMGADGQCALAPGGAYALPPPATGDLVLVVPVAPGKTAEVGRVIYMEGKEPAEVGGRLSAVDGFQGDLKAGPDWQPLVAPALIPAR